MEDRPGCEAPNQARKGTALTVSNDWLATYRQENPRWYEPAAVYRLWDTDGNLIYIGSAYDPDDRCKSHRTKPWWTEVARRTDEWHPGRGAAYIEEMKAIAAELPKYNQMGTPGYVAPQTEKLKRRNALARVRNLLVRQADEVHRDVRQAAEEAGYLRTEAGRMATMAQIEFLDRTGIFEQSVKRRREQFERGHGSGWGTKSRAKKADEDSPQPG